MNMDFTNEFLHILNTSNSKISKINIDLPLIYNGLVNIYLVDNFIYLVPVSDKVDFKLIINLHNYLVTKNEYSRVYVYVPKCYRDNIDLLIASKINFLNYMGNERFFYSKQSQVIGFEKEESVNFTKATQLVFKCLVLKRLSSPSVREIGRITGLSISTVSVSLFALYKLGVVELMSNLVNSQYSFSLSNKVLTSLQDYFINPIKSRSYIYVSENMKNIIIDKYPLSSEYAFEKYTDLANNTNIIQIAVSSKERLHILNEINNSDDGKDKKYLVEIQSFIYDSKLFIKDNVIDKFDTYLILLFKSNKDSREIEAMNNLRKELIHGQK